MICWRVVRLGECIIAGTFFEVMRYGEPTLRRLMQSTVLLKE